MNNRSSGFTIIEILLVIGIIGIIAVMTMFVNLDFYKTYDFQSEKGKVISLLEKARSQSLNNINDSKHGVYFDSSNYTLFEGNDYGSRIQSKDQVFPANSRLSHSGLSEVVFGRLTGDTTGGTITLTDGVHSVTLSLNNEGRIDW